MDHPRAVAASIEAEEVEQAEAKRRSDLVREAQELFTSARAIHEHSTGATRDYEDAFECYGKVVAGMHVDGFVGNFTAQIPEQTRDLSPAQAQSFTETHLAYKKLLSSYLLACARCSVVSSNTVHVRTVTHYSELLQKGGDYLSIAEFESARRECDFHLSNYLFAPVLQDNIITTSYANYRHPMATTYFGGITELQTSAGL